MIDLPDELVATLQAVSAAPSWEEKGDLIRLHPEVMETRSLLLLTELLARARAADESEACAVGLLTRTLLERCRSHGVADALAELADLIPIDSAGNATMSRGTLGRLDELLLEELIGITSRNNLDDPVEAAYAVARADEALAMSDDARRNSALHLLAGTAWRHLMPTEGAAVAGHRALAHLGAGLDIVDAHGNPVIFGNLQNELGLVLLDLPGGDQRGRLDDAVVAFRAALEVWSREAMRLEWAASTNNLAMALTRYRTHDWVERTEQAIVHFEAALEVLAHDGPSRNAFRAYLDLGTAHARLGSLDESHVDRAIDAYTSALALASAEIPKRELAACLINRGGALRDKAAAMEARRDALEALKLITPGSSPAVFATAQEIVGDTFSQRWPEDGADTLRAAITHYKQASQAVGVNEEPVIRRQVDRALGDAYLLMGEFESARASYGLALSAHENLYQAAVGEVGRFQESGAVAGLYDRDAYAHLKCGRFEPGLLRLEAGRARWITARLALDHIELGLLGAESRAAFSALRVQIDALQAESRAQGLGSDPTWRHELADATRRMRQLLTDVQASNPAVLPQTLTIADFKAAIPAGGALVYLVVTAAGGAALILSHDMEALGEENVVWLDNLTSAAVDEILRGPDGWFLSYFGSDGQQEQAIVDVGGRLWELAMAELHDRLVNLGFSTGAPVVLVPPGALAVLPLHSAWHTADSERRAFADHWTVSYVPSGFSLSISGARAEGADGEGMLVVMNPTGDLPGTMGEADDIQALIRPVTPLKGSDATRQEVIDGIPGKRYVHFACHGSYAWSDPLQSQFELAAGTRLTLADVLSTADLSHARLVTLSACETGLIDLAQSPDDYVGFAAGFLQAGAAGVVSTLWPVYDVSTAVLLTKFYRLLLAESLDPASALQRAQRFLRSTAEQMDLAGWFERRYEASGGTDRDAFEAALYHRSNPEERPFAHPVFWAGFVFTGV